MEGRYPYWFVDAKVEKVRAGGRVVHKCVVIAHLVHETGRREIIGLDVGEAETEAFWREFLRGLVARGLVGVQLAISNAHHDGLDRATIGSGAHRGQRDPQSWAASRSELVSMGWMFLSRRMVVRRLPYPLPRVPQPWVSMAVFGGGGRTALRLAVEPARRRAGAGLGEGGASGRVGGLRAESGS